MATPAEKIKRLRLPGTSGKDPYATPPKPGSYGTGKQGPLTEALREKRARQEARSTSTDTAAPTAKPAPAKAESPSEAPAKKSFSQAFREARESGKDSFTWNGKKYTTEMSGESKPAKEVKFESSNPEVTDYEEGRTTAFKRGGMVKSSASKRADGCAQRGKTRGRMI